MLNSWYEEVEDEYCRLKKETEDLTTRIGEYPSGVLQINHKNGYIQYYQMLDGGKAKYIRKENHQIAALLAQKSYDKKLLKELEKRRDALDHLIKTYRGTDPFAIIDGCCAERQKLIKTDYISDERFAEMWQAMDYERKPFAENAPEILTVKGERVRSKSEKIIADTLERNGIPYHYEYPLELPGPRHKETNMLHPDFYVLNKRTRKAYYWEHLGLLDDPDYYSGAVKRLQLMGSNGILLGKDLLLTAETRTSVLNMTMVNTLIREYLL